MALTGRAATRIGYGVVAFGLATAVLQFVIRIGQADLIRGHIETNEQASLAGDAIAVAGVAGAFVVAFLGTLIIKRDPTNVIGWVFIVAGFVLPVGGFSEVYAVWSEARGTSLPGATVASAFYEAGGAFFWAPLFALLLLFPDGTPPPGRWRWLVPAVTIVLSGFVLDPLLGLGIADLLWPLHLAMLLLSAMALVVRYRRSRGLERQQLRWIAASGGTVCLGAIVLFTTGAASDGAGDEWWMLIGPALVVVGFGSIPVAATVAITRYRLYDLDRLVSRASAYLGTVAAVAAIYVGAVIGAGAVVPAARGSDLAVAASTLIAAAVFSPLQRRLRIVIDRRFHRQRYDAVVALERLGARLRDEVDEASLVANVSDTLTATLQPANVSVWLAR